MDTAGNSPPDAVGRLRAALQRERTARLEAEAIAERGMRQLYQKTQEILRDFNHRRQLEDQLRQAQKMEAVGQLAGGVAHDFNNLLTIIIGYSDVLLAGMRPENPAQPLIQEIKKAGHRAEGLTRQLLAFSRKQIIQPCVLDLNAILTDMGKLLRRVIGEDIDLGLVLDRALGPVKADPGQMEQVVMNLAVNARDAMPRGGKLTIETRNVEFNDDYVGLHAEATPGRYVLIAVSDTGCGMDAATRARVFEPFFTTKEIGKGTGLGLATVYGIIKQAGGRVEVYSEVGLGTSFKVYLPVTDECAYPFEAGPRTTDAGVRGNETILLAEDEEGVRALITRILLEHGYTILVAGSGAEALQTAAQHPGMIDLLLTDVVMPGMSGRELSERLLPSRPATRTLYLSGYTDDAVVRHGVLAAEAHFLQKPFSPARLTRKVRDLLDGPIPAKATAKSY